MTVSDDSLTIAKGDSEVVTVSGGVEPYTADTNKASIHATVSDDEVTISVDDNSNAQSGVVTITDANENTVTVDITVE